MKAKPIFEDLAKVADLAAAVRVKLAYMVTVEYPGVIAVTMIKDGREHELCFGNANPVIGCDVNVLDNGRMEPTDLALTTYVESACDDVATVAAGIVAAVNRFEKH